MIYRINMKIASLLSAIVVFLGLATSAGAFSFGVGVSGGGTYADLSGKETMNTSGNTTSAEEGAAGPIGTAYAQVIVGESYFGEGNGFALGYEHFFGGASTNMQSGDERTDLYAVNTSTLSINHAKARIEDINTIFIETPGFTPLGIYLKAGLSNLTLITNEALFTGGVYGDADVDGNTVGFGFKKAAGGFQAKTEFTYTDWDAISISNTGSNAGASKITGDIENWAFKFGVGYNF